MKSRPHAIVWAIAAIAAVAATLAAPGIGQAHTGATTFAGCIRNYPNAPYVYVDTPANVQFLSTGSSATQTVWFRASYYVAATGASLGSGEWFYNYVSPGQATTSYWYRYTTGQVNVWRSSRSITTPNAGGYVKYDVYWYQNGREVHHDAIWPMHTYPRGDGQNGNACFWLY